MDWETLYKQRTTSAEEALKHISNGSRVVSGHAAGEPSYLLTVMSEHKEWYQDVEICHMVSLGQTLDSRGYALRADVQLSRKLRNIHLASGKPLYLRQDRRYFL